MSEEHRSADDEGMMKGCRHCWFAEIPRCSILWCSDSNGSRRGLEGPVRSLLSLFSCPHVLMPSCPHALMPSPYLHASCREEAARRYHGARKLKDMRFEQSDHSLSKLRETRDVLNICSSSPHACPRSLWRSVRQTTYHSLSTKSLPVSSES